MFAIILLIENIILIASIVTKMTTIPPTHTNNIRFMFIAIYIPFLYKY